MTYIVIKRGISSEKAATHSGFFIAAVLSKPPALARTSLRVDSSVGPTNLGSSHPLKQGSPEQCLNASRLHVKKDVVPQHHRL